MFIDNVNVTFQGGKGGNGIVSFGKMAHSGPDGGSGGKGGDLYLVAKTDLTLLNQFSRKKLYAAPDGEPGGKNKRTGKNGENLEIFVPIGTSVVDTMTGNTLFELTKKDQNELLTEGGNGGRGNFEFRSPIMTTPMISEPGDPGELKNVTLNLKLIADYGLIGLPNAGKSSLLNELTKAKAKTANYSFTTLSPNLGVFNGKIIADIPGLIEGAHLGKGLGIAFLKHIEKVKIILHCISVDSEDPIKAYKTVRTELLEFNSTLIEKEEIILLTKSDLVPSEEITILSKKFKKTARHVLPVSIHDWESLGKLKNLLKN